LVSVRVNELDSPPAITALASSTMLAHSATESTGDADLKTSAPPGVAPKGALPWDTRAFGAAPSCGSITTPFMLHASSALVVASAHAWVPSSHPSASACSAANSASFWDRASANRSGLGGTVSHASSGGSGSGGGCSGNSGETVASQGVALASKTKGPANNIDYIK
jgi:hypothetical protein